MGGGIEKCSQCLSRKCPAAGIGNGSGNHDRNADFFFFGQKIDSEQGGFGIEGVEDGFYQQDICPGFEQGFGLFVVVVA